MPVTLVMTNNFEHLSKVASDIVKKKLIELFKETKEIVLGLATGNDSATRGVEDGVTRTVEHECRDFRSSPRR
jgi:hypothetical protein